MRLRHPVTAVVLAAVLVVAPLPAVADTNDMVAAWEMNEARGSRTMIDSSGNGYRGTIGREVGTGLRSGGATGYRFDRLPPDRPPTHPGHLITVPDRSALDPGTRDFAVTLRLRTTHKFGNIIQKGQATVSGGSWKIEIPNGIVRCVYRGSAGSILLTTPRRLNDGNWHTVRCARTRQGVFLSADGRVVAQRLGRVGKIANSWPVTIGGKVDCDQIDVGCDYYAGDLDWVTITSD